jgi:hypothetical protein
MFKQTLFCYIAGWSLRASSWEFSAEEELFASESEFNTVFEEFNKNRTDIWRLEYEVKDRRALVASAEINS